MWVAPSSDPSFVCDYPISTTSEPCFGEVPGCDSYIQEPE